MEKTNWTTHAEWVVMFMTIIAGFYMIDAKTDSQAARTDQLILAWHEESKDFHGRLCSIEERNKAVK